MLIAAQTSTAQGDEELEVGGEENDIWISKRDLKVVHSHAMSSLQSCELEGPRLGSVRACFNAMRQEVIHESLEQVDERRKHKLLLDITCVALGRKDSVTNLLAVLTIFDTIYSIYLIRKHQVSLRGWIS